MGGNNFAKKKKPGAWVVSLQAEEGRRARGEGNWEEDQEAMQLLTSFANL